MTDELRSDQTTDTPVDQVDQVDVRRNVALSAVVGGLAALLTIAFAARAFGGGEVLDWAAFGVLGLITVIHLAAVLDGRAPLLVADRQGVRLREGSTWQGIAWPEVECLEHLPRRLPFHDGHLLVVGYDAQQLIVPLTLATRVVGAEREALSDVLAELADGRADVVEVVPGLADDEGADPADLRSENAETDDDTSEIARVTAATAADVPSDHDDAATDDGAAAPAPEPSGDRAAFMADEPSPAPGRPPVQPARVEVQRTGFVRTLLHRASADASPVSGANALRAEPLEEAALPEIDQLRRTSEPDSDPIWQIAEARPTEDTATVVLDDLAVHPAPEPVVGPELAAARERLRLTVDQLSERTRIRPHVIEAIEVDDFGPCGGDFYARGHLRTLSRVLGIEAAPLVEAYDEKYADAPLDPRRVFEAELATGVGGSIRGTRGGRNWSVLIAAVMAAVLVWSIARLAMDGPVPVGQEPVLNQSGGISQGKTKVDPLPVTLTAAGGGARLVVRDGNGDIVFDGPLAFGQTSQLEVVPPVRIWSSDGSVTASVDGSDAGALGQTGEEVTKTLVAPTG